MWYLLLLIINSIIIYLKHFLDSHLIMISLTKFLFFLHNISSISHSSMYVCMFIDWNLSFYKIICLTYLSLQWMYLYWLQVLINCKEETYTMQHPMQKLGFQPLLLVANNWTIQNDAKNLKKITETLAYGTHLRVLSESHPMNTNMTRFRHFSKSFAFLCCRQK